MQSGRGSLRDPAPVNISSQPGLRALFAPRNRYSTRYQWYSIKSVDIDTGAGPTAGVRRITGTGITYIPIHSFGLAAQYYDYITIPSPDDLNPNNPVYINLVWYPAAGGTTGAVRWTGQYHSKVWTGADVTAGTNTTFTALLVTPANAVNDILSEFADGITLGASQLLHLGLSRNPAHADDTSDAAAELAFVGLRYTAYKSGENDHPDTVIW